MIPRIINLLVAGLVLYIIYAYLAPLLPHPLVSIVQIATVIIGIIYLLGEFTGYQWWWRR
jgi:hypothetical protein